MLLSQQRMTQHKRSGLSSCSVISDIIHHLFTVRHSQKLITLLSQCDAVVLQEDDFKAISHHGVIINDISDGRDQLDDHLGSVVSWSSLETQKAHAGKPRGSPHPQSSKTGVKFVVANS